MTTTIPRKADLRPNAYPGTCSDCGREVTKMAGYLGPKIAGAWTIHHKSCAPATAPARTSRTSTRQYSAPRQYGRRTACISGGDCSSMAPGGRSCGGYDCDGW